MAMRLIFSLADWKKHLGPALPPTVLSIGNFDGLHLGHQKILRRVVERARAGGALAAAVTFDPHPLKVLRPEAAPPLIDPLKDRLAGLEWMGVEATLVLPFDRELSQLTAEQFVRRILVDQLHLRAILVGANFRFGHQQAGDVRLLTALSASHGYEVEVVQPVLRRGEIVSSTAIRNAVRSGDVARAGRFLGRPFSLAGQIFPATGTGRRLLVPTLNLVAEQELLPARGVYVTETWLVNAGADLQIGPPGFSPPSADVGPGFCPSSVESALGPALVEQSPGATHPPRSRFRSVTNVGVRPTFRGSRLSIESHLFDFSGELASGRMVVAFWCRLRDEKKFAGPEELLRQIQLDMARAKAFFRRLDRSRELFRSHPGHAPEPF